MTLRCQNVFVVFDAFCVHLPMRFCSKVQHNPLNNEKTSFELHFLEKTLQHFASKNNSESLQSSRKNSTSSFFYNLCFFNRFGDQMLTNVQQRLNSSSGRLLKECLQTSAGKCLKIVENFEFFVDFPHFQ